MIIDYIMIYITKKIEEGNKFSLIAQTHKHTHTKTTTTKQGNNNEKLLLKEKNINKMNT